jgi:hypothetical protein
MLSAMAANAPATVFTTTSPTGALPAGVTQVGGIVLDLVGLNGTRVVTQAAASGLYLGFAENEPQTIGTQTGFTSAVLAALGGGLISASARVTLFDGDSATGNFDDGQNEFLVNGISFGNFSAVGTEQTSSDGTGSFGFSTGFGDDILSTGFFTASGANAASLFATLATGSANFSLSDQDPFDNYYDFTAGVDGGLVDVGSGPIVTPAVPEPSTWAMMLGGMGLVGGLIRRRPSQKMRTARL